MKRLLTLIALLLCSLCVSAQTFTIQNLVVNGTSSLTGAVSGAGVTSLFAAPPPLGSTTPNSAAVTTLVGSGQASLGGTAGAEALRAVTTASAVNWVQVAGSATGSGVSIGAAGTDANIQFNVNSKGSGGVYFFGQGVQQFAIIPTASATRSITVTGSNGGNPTIGTSAGNIALSAALAPSTTLGIIGTVAGDNANAGSVGEHPTANTLTTSLTTGTPANATSISLTAGNWLIFGLAQFNPAATTTTSSAVVGISTTSATFQTAVSGINNFTLINYGSSATNSNVATNLMAPPTWVNPTTTTTYYLVAQAGFATSTMTVSGYIWAIRLR